MEDTRNASTAAVASERLLEDSWEARSRRASRRELLVEVGAGALFLAATGTLLAVSGAAHLRVGLLALLIVMYLAVARVEFPIGAGHVVPTQLVLMPMLVLLPPAVVPIAVAIALVLLSMSEWALGRATTRRIVSSVPDAWHALGPAIVLAACGRPEPTLDALPVFAAAFAASCVTDLASSLTRMRLTGLVSNLKAPLGVMFSVCAVDACLAPIGFVTALSVDEGQAAVLLVLPLTALLWQLARDRNQRIEQAHARLKLVEHERTRLQSAVRRLGDAFVAKLELDGLFEILLHGSLEALDADAGRLEVSGLPSDTCVTAGNVGVPRIDGAPCAEPRQERRDGSWTLVLPVRIAREAGDATGALVVVRHARRFEGDEIALLAELVGKAELAAADILDHHALRTEAVTDALTGLGNRRKLASDLGDALDAAAPDRPSLLLLFDLNGFKGYNDTFGHLAGDALLARLGGKLADAVARHGTAYRLGGDEFCALLALDGTDLEAVERASEALTENGERFSISASLGVVLLPHEADSADHALQLADERMYANKRGRPTGPRDQARDVLMRTMQAKQPDLDEHADEVADLARRVALRLGLAGEDLDEVARAAELHDVGKVGIPDAILNKPAGLDPIEWEYMRQHTILGERILNAAPALRPVARLVRASHERWDGTGYPDRLAGEDIPLGARIVAVCDAYHAMTADRPYRQALPHDVACTELRAGAGGQFDPGVVEAFLAVVDDDRHVDDGAPDHLHAAAAHIRALLTTGATPR
jgi:diguanylate cyclase (GGDEF)-like protein